MTTIKKRHEVSMNTGLVVAMTLTRLPLRDHGSHQQLSLQYPFFPFTL